MKSLIISLIYYFLFLNSFNLFAQRVETEVFYYAGTFYNKSSVIYDTLKGSSVIDPQSKYYSNEKYQLRGYSSQQFKEYKPIAFAYDENSSFKNGDEYIFFSKNTGKIRITTLDSTVLKESNIKIRKPFIWTRNDISILKDNSELDFYIISETAFNFYIYQLNHKTGKTKMIKKINEVWNNPNFRIEYGQLHYQRTKAGKLENYTLDLKN
jgi:hypothetical protein